jgi:hypothetical protein
MGMKDSLRKDATEGFEKESCVVRWQTGYPRGGLVSGEWGWRCVEGREGLTVVCLKADVHEYRLVLSRGPGERVCVEHLPCYRSIGVSSHVGAVALAGAVLKLWKRGTAGTDRAVLGLLLRLALF